MIACSKIYTLFRTILLFVFLSVNLLPSGSFGYQKQKGKDFSKIKSTQRPYIIDNKVYYPIPSAHGYKEIGTASWYGPQFHGRKTSNGEIYNMNAQTAAHKTLPMNTMLLVKNLENGKKTTVRINDRGPFVKNRILDLSYSTARELGIVRNGTASVQIIALAEKKQLDENRFSDEEDFNVQDFNKGQFYVQVGSFAIKSNADRLAEKFARQGSNVIIQKFSNSENTFYRIMVFAGTTLSNAHHLEKQLSLNGFPDSFVIAR
jgi:rare lipoprotein A